MYIQHHSIYPRLNSHLCAPLNRIESKRIDRQQGSFARHNEAIILNDNRAEWNKSSKICRHKMLLKDAGSNVYTHASERAIVVMDRPKLKFRWNSHVVKAWAPGME